MGDAMSKPRPRREGGYRVALQVSETAGFRHGYYPSLSTRTGFVAKSQIATEPIRMGDAMSKPRPRREGGYRATLQ